MLAQRRVQETASVLLKFGAVASLRRRMLRRRWGTASKLPAPPKCPKGWHVRPPTWVGVGVQKAGTTWWHSLIAAHPDVVMTSGLPKELHFFDRFWNQDLSKAETQLYAEYFCRPTGRAAGEWTPRYMFDPWTPALLRQAAPDARIIVLLRDPIERYRSGLSYDLERGGVFGPTLASIALTRGLYSQQMRRLRCNYPREQILVLQYEKCSVEPTSELRRTYEFLRFENVGFLPRDLRSCVNRSRRSAFRVADSVPDSILQIYEDDVSMLLEQCPGIDLSLWPNFAHMSSDTTS